MKILSVLFFLASFAFGQSSTEQRKTYYSNGNIKTQYTYVDSIPNGPYIGYYEDGRKWSEGQYMNGKLTDTFKVYTPKGDLAYEKFYSEGKTISKKIFWQDLPNKEFIFVSKEGFYVLKDGKPIELDSLTPNGIIQKTIDESNTVRTYIWENGKRVLYENGKPDNTKEIIYEGDKAGIYEWQNGKLVFIRKLNNEDIEEKKKLEKEAKDALKKNGL
jgi:antitoxin component YwqK of YwqJK toxin-antitoxin module